MIENTQLPDWDMKCQIAKARGEPPPKERTIVFPSEDMMIKAMKPQARGDTCSNER